MDSDELREAWEEAQMEDRRRANEIYRWPQTVQFSDDSEVEILARAVRDLKNATKREMSRQLSISGSFSLAHASFVAPGFFWTTIDPHRLDAEDVIR